MNTKSCSGWCWPTIIYMALAFLGLILVTINQQPGIVFSSDEDKYKYLFKSLVQILFWTFLLFMLCSKCKYTIAWGILFLPFVLMLFVFILFIGILRISRISRISRSHSDVNNIQRYVY
jgi:hypothetical protein